MLTRQMLEVEGLGRGQQGLAAHPQWNDLGDIVMAPLASMLRLTTHLEALHLQNVGISPQGLSEIVAGIATNKSLRLLDVRQNGLCSPEIGSASVEAVRRSTRGSRSSSPEQRPQTE